MFWYQRPLWLTLQWQQNRDQKILLETTTHLVLTVRMRSLRSGEGLMLTGANVQSIHTRARAHTHTHTHRIYVFCEILAIHVNWPEHVFPVRLDIMRKFLIDAEKVRSVNEGDVNGGYYVLQQLQPLTYEQPCVRVFIQSHFQVVSTRYCQILTEN